MSRRVSEQFDMKKYQREWYKRNKQKHNKQGQINYQKNKEYIQNKHKEWIKLHPEKSRVYSKKWRMNNLDKVKQYQKEYSNRPEVQLKKKRYREKYLTELQKENRKNKIKMKIEKPNNIFFKKIYLYTQQLEIVKKTENYRKKINKNDEERKKKSLIKKEKRKLQKIKNQIRQKNAIQRRKKAQIAKENRFFREISFGLRQRLYKIRRIKLNKEYYKDNKKRINEVKKIWNEKNKEKILLKKKIYWNTNRTKFLKMAKLNRLKNIKQYALRNKIYSQKHPEIKLRSNKKALKKLGKFFNMNGMKYGYTMMSWRYVIKKTQKYCAVCKSIKKLRVHHIFYKSNYPQLSLNINNGIVLCNKHHMECHGWNIKKWYYDKINGWVYR